MTIEPPPHLHDNHQFGKAAVSFAVDVSGSTYGHTLKAEQFFIENVSRLLSPKSQMTARILPWNNKAKPVLGLSQLNTLKSSGYTIPGVIVEDKACNAALDQSSLWFLLTDGLVDDVYREHFAKLIAKHRLHGISCVAIIFGEAGREGPGSCNISVGVSLYAIVPNCLFLFYNTLNHEIMIMQCKGVFKSLLGNVENPIIDDNTTWESFPRLSVNKLSTLVIPPPKRLEEDEIAFDGDLVIRFEELWSNSLSQEQISKILTNEDNLSTLVMTTQSRGDVGRFQSWIQAQSMKVDDPLTKPRPDINGSASAIFQEVIAASRAGGMPNDETRRQLRSAYTTNMAAFRQQYHLQVQEVQTRQSIIHTSSVQSASNINSAQSLNRTQYYSSSRFSSRNNTPVFTPQTMSPQVTSPVDPSCQSWASTPSNLNSSPYAPSPPSILQHSPNNNFGARAGPHQLSQPDLIYTPGFRCRTESFKGNCSICGAQNTTLAWLFRSPLGQESTPSFPAIGSNSDLEFPLAMGGYSEMNVISETICCEPCSNFCVGFGSPDVTESIIGALPMISFPENSQKFEEVLYAVFGGRLAQKHVIQVFLSILLSMLQQPRLSGGNDSDAASLQCHQAIRWVCKDLIKNLAIEIPSSMLPSSASEPSSNRLLSQLTKTSFDNTSYANSFLIRYPLEGFAVILRASALVGVPIHLRQRVMFHRYLYLLTDSFKSQRLSNSQMNPLLWTDLETESLSQNLSPECLYTGSTGSPGNLVPRASLSISNLRNTVILSDQMYGALHKLEEFCFLEDVEWVGLVTAVYLHALMVADTALGQADAWDLFIAIMTNSELTSISEGPENMTINMSEGIIHTMYIDVQVHGRQKFMMYKS
ncbi:hypothetical protein AOQ84DRAFT_407046 [Glonium stellatum]|uniref:Uncharacterized protein n=1 Tax=Glonium stellatum TaxID=574774 RepID=A0A8E2F1Q7_9PEZI|nr:hypothetical protein AOQ84DRAFT_407046 [Glonium stellatum]